MVIVGWAGPPFRAGPGFRKFFGSPNHTAPPLETNARAVPLAERNRVFVVRFLFVQGYESELFAWGIPIGEVFQETKRFYPELGTIAQRILHVDYGGIFSDHTVATCPAVIPANAGIQTRASSQPKIHYTSVKNSWRSHAVQRPVEFFV